MTAAQAVSQPPLNLELCQSMAMQVGLQLIHAFPFVSCEPMHGVAPPNTMLHVFPLVHPQQLPRP